MMVKNNRVLQDETFISGETEPIDFYFQDEETGQPISLSGFTAVLKVSPLGDTKALILEKQCEVSTTVLGKVSVNLSSSDTSKLNLGCYEFNIVATSASGEVRKARGIWFVEGGVM